MSILQTVLESHLNRIKAALPDEYKDNESYAFMIFATSIILNCSLNEAILNSVEGSEDGGIDAIEIDQSEIVTTINIIQSKYRDNLNKSISPSEIQKTLNTVKNIFEGRNIERLSTRLKEKISELRDILAQEGTLKLPSVNIYFITNGQLPLEQDREPAYQLQQQGNYKIFFYGPQDLLDIIDTDNKQEYTLKVRTLGKIVIQEIGNTRGIVATLPATQLIKIYEQGGGDKSLDKNIRNYLGDNKINKRIRATAESKDDSKYFWFFNNGVSIVCDRFLTTQDSLGNEFIEITNANIVNGGQTTKSLYWLNKENKSLASKQLDKVYLLARIYETSDENLISRITEGTNSQNPINIRDLKSNNKIQNIVKSYFKGLGIYLETKRNEYREIAEVPIEKVVNNQRVFQAYIALYKFNPHEAKGRKSATFQKYFEEVFTSDNTKLPEEFYRSYLILTFVENKERNSTIESENSYLPHADIALIYLMGLVSPWLKRTNRPKNQKLEDVYQKANVLIKKMVAQEQKALGETYSHNKLFKSSRVEDLARVMFTKRKK